MDYRKRKFRIYSDVETTGFCPIRNDVVSIALIVANENMEIQDKFCETVRPDFNKFYSEDAEKIHGFTKRKMKKFQDPRSLCINILNFLKPFKDEGDFPQLFISHSIGQFDYRFVEWLFRKQELQWSLWKVLDQSKQRSTIKAGRARGYKTNKLDEWAKRLGFDLQHHSAESDTMCCYEIDKFLMREL